MRRFLLSLSLIVCAISMSFAEEVTLNYSAQGYANAEDVTSTEVKDANGALIATINVAAGTSQNSPKYYDTGNGLRLYSGNTMTFEMAGNCKVTKVVFTFSTSGYGFKSGLSVSTGSVSSLGSAIQTWTSSSASGDASFTITSNATVRLQTVDITYSGTPGPALEQANLSFPETEYAATLGELFTAPVLSKDTDAAASYTSTNEDVATVDPTTGAITLVAGGETTITATTPATDTYQAGTASYLLVVTDPNKINVTFDFVNNTYGLERGGSKYHEDGTTITNEVVSIVMNKVSGNGFRLWSDGMRVYKGTDKMTISAPGYNIIEVTITANANLPIKFDNETSSVSDKTRTWTGSQEELVVTFVPTSTTALETIKVVCTSIGDPSKENVELTFPEESYTAIYPGTFTAPALTKSADVAVTYTSTDESVATVDAATGAVTLVGPGSTTIKVESEETDDYNSGSTFYNLTVELGAQSLAEIYDAGTGVTCVVNFDMTVTYINGRNIYVKAGEEYGLVYDNQAADTKFAVGDVIPAGWKANYNDYNGLPEVVPVGELPASLTSDIFVPRTVSEITKDMLNEIVVLENVTFAEATLATRTPFTGTVGQTEYTFYNTYLLASVEAGKYNVKGAVSIYKETLQFIPIEYNVIHPDVEVSLARATDGSKVIVTLSVPEDSPAGTEIWYKVEDLADVPAQAASRVAGDTNADGYTLYTQPFEITKASLLSYYTEINGVASEPKTLRFKDDLTTGVENIAVDAADTEVRYYDLSGRRVYNPAAGLYIRVQGGKASKTIF